MTLPAPQPSDTGSGQFFNIAHAQVGILLVGVFFSADFSCESYGILRRDVDLSEKHGAEYL